MDGWISNLSKRKQGLFEKLKTRKENPALEEELQTSHKARGRVKECRRIIKIGCIHNENKVSEKKQGGGIIRVLMDTQSGYSETRKSPGLSRGHVE